MSKKETDPRYNADDLPPIKNYPAYFWRVFRKLFVVTFFALGTFVIVAVVFPLMRLIVHNDKKFRKGAHYFISTVLEFYIHLMSWLRISTFKVTGLETLRQIKGAVIVANHPSLLDVLYILSFVRDATCLVKAGLQKSWVGGITRTLYISNSVDFSLMQQECVESLHEGCNLIIFPEGTRSPRHGTNPYKKGAARIAIAAKATVLPIHIGGNDKYGLGKGESMLKANHEESYKYEFTVLPEIDVSKYEGLPETIAAKHLSDDMRLVIDSIK